MEIISTCNNLPTIESDQDSFEFTIRANGWRKTVTADSHINAILKIGIVLPIKYNASIIGNTIKITF